MTISVGFTTETLPIEEKTILQQIPGVEVVRWGNSYNIFSRDILLTSADELVSLLGLSTILIDGYDFAFSLYDTKWEKPEPTWIAAELIGDESVFLDDGNFFNPILPYPCLGMVSPEIPIHIAEKPRGLACSAKWDTIFSKVLCDFFAKKTEGIFGPVLYKGQVLKDWHRFFPNQRESILVEAGLRLGNCRACRTPGRWSPGILLGRSLHGSDICQDEIGITHGNIEHPYILSAKVACELACQIPQGYGLRPIIDVDSPIGQRILELLDRIKRLPIAPAL